jgi:hypothetical protein
MRPLILIGNPDNRRTAGLQEARRSLGLEPAYVLSYLELLRGEKTLAHAVEQLGQLNGSRPLLRIDAPGEHFEVERQLIALGAPDCKAGQEDEGLLAYGRNPDPNPLLVQEALAIREQEGCLYHPSQWFRGFGRLLARLDRQARGLWQAPCWLNAPADIAAMFDKRQTHQRLRSAGVPVPGLLALPEALLNYETLRETMLRKRMHRVFVKLAAGSGACGVIAYQLNPRTGAELAVTTLSVESDRTGKPVYYNAIKPRRYLEQKSIGPMMNWLLQHGAHVEQWIPKATYKGNPFDVRQLVVAGRACHHIARVSRTSITNLHLRSERMNLDDIGLSAEVQRAVEECAEQALSAFPNSHVAGIDVLLQSGSHSPFVLDVNPFGDLLYRVNYKGYDTYTWEMKRLLEHSLWTENPKEEGVSNS